MNKEKIMAIDLRTINIVEAREELKHTYAKIGLDHGISAGRVRQIMERHKFRMLNNKSYLQSVLEIQY